jgi:hypothetical protein
LPFRLPPSFPGKTVNTDHPVHESYQEHEAYQDYQVGGEEGEDEVERVFQPIGADQYLDADGCKKHGKKDKADLPEPPEITEIESF